MSTVERLTAIAPRAIAAALSGLVMVLICPPVGMTWLQWFAYVPMLWALRADEHKTNTKLAYGFGWVMLFSNFFWLADTVVIFSSLPYVLSIGVVVLFATVWALPYMVVFGPSQWLRQRLGLSWIFIVPALQVANEALWPSLFPYYLGSVQYRSGDLWQLASVTGVAGVSYLMVFTNCALAEGLYRLSEKRRPPIAVYVALAGVIAGILAWGSARYDAVEQELAEAPVIRAAIIQQANGMEEWLMMSAWEALQSWVLLTRQLSDLDPDLVVWPEGSVILNPDSEQEYRALGGMSPQAFFSKMVSQGHYDFLIGGGTIELLEGTTDNGRQRFTAYNSCYAFDRDGELNGRYDKMKPLPFGEYLPLADVFPFLRDLIQGPGNFRAGEEVTFFQGSHRDGTPYTYTTPICYEAILTGQMWKMQQSDLFVNITNDAWFGDTAAPHQHGMLAAVQAIEHGRPMLRIAFTGVSFIVEPHGNILYETKPFTEVVKVEELRMARIETLYARGGWMFSWLCILSGLGGLGLARRKHT